MKHWSGSNQSRTQKKDMLREKVLMLFGMSCVGDVIDITGRSVAVDEVNGWDEAGRTITNESQHKVELDLDLCNICDMQMVRETWKNSGRREHELCSRSSRCMNSTTFKNEACRV